MNIQGNITIKVFSHRVWLYISDVPNFQSNPHRVVGKLLPRGKEKGGRKGGGDRAKTIDRSLSPLSKNKAGSLKKEVPKFATDREGI